MKNNQNKLDMLFEKARNEENLISTGDARRLIETSAFPNPAIHKNVGLKRILKPMNIISLTIIAAGIAGWLTFGADTPSVSDGTVPGVTKTVAAEQNYSRTAVPEAGGMTADPKDGVASVAAVEHEEKATTAGNDSKNTTAQASSSDESRKVNVADVKRLELTPDELKSFFVTIDADGSLSFNAFTDSRTPVNIRLNGSNVSTSFIDNSGRKTPAPVFVTDLKGNRILSLFKSSDGRNYLSYEKDIDESDLKNEKFLVKNNIKQIKADVKIDIEKHKDLIDKSMADKVIDMNELGDMIKMIVDGTVVNMGDNKMKTGTIVSSNCRIDSVSTKLDSLVRALNMETSLTRNGKAAKIYIRSKAANGSGDQVFDFSNSPGVTMFNGMSPTVKTLTYPLTDSNRLKSLQYPDSSLLKMFQNSDSALMKIYQSPSSAFSLMNGNDSTFIKLQDLFKNMKIPDVSLNFHINIPDSLFMPRDSSVVRFLLQCPDSMFNNGQFLNFKDMKLPDFDTSSIMDKYFNINIDSLIDLMNRKSKHMFQRDGSGIKITPDSAARYSLSYRLFNGGVESNSQGLNCDINKFRKELDDYSRVNKFIAVSVPDKEIPGFGYILWYEPSLDFIESIPERYRVNLLEEYNAAKTDDICNNPAIAGEETYFDIWKSCSGAIENLNIYPNPVGSTLNMKFELTDNRRLTFRIYSLSGQILTTFKNNVSYNPGEYKDSFNVDSLEPGLYLISITSEKGEKVLQRFIVE